MMETANGWTAIVTGASRGFGRATTVALVAAGARVIGVARSQDALAELQTQLGDAFTPIVADATGAEVAEAVLEQHAPRLLVLNAGATPHMAPVQEQTWETFSDPWEVDVKHVFHWTGAALRRPLDPGSLVVALSSGAALQGSPLSGGYAGAKAAIRFLSSYANGEAERAALGIRFVSLLPQLTPATQLGATGVAAYAGRQGVDPATFVSRRGPTLSPERVGAAVVELALGGEPAADSFLVGPDGLRAIT
jgi:NADP-dependent 3-hydroxy acid dehydrogenase YdfG